MNYGFYLSASGALTALHRIEIASNNLANVATTGFKPDAVATRQREPERLEDGTPVPPNELLERLGGGVLNSPTRVVLAQGGLETTGNALDLALVGKGFLALRLDDAPNRTALTRDGRLTLSSDGTLVHASSALPVLDRSNRVIALDVNARVSIDRAGNVRQRGVTVAQLSVVDVDDSTALRKRGENLLTHEGRLTPSRTEVIAGSVENSGVDPVLALNALIRANRAVTSNTRMMQYQNRAMEQAITSLGKVG